MIFKHGLLEPSEESESLIVLQDCLLKNNIARSGDWHGSSMTNFNWNQMIISNKDHKVRL